MKHFQKIALTLIIAPLSLSAPALAAGQTDTMMSATTVTTPLYTTNEFAKFTPRTQTKRTRLNYDVMDAALKDSVFNLGASIRRRASLPAAASGTRFIRGHRSPYRMEGSRVRFSFLKGELLEALTEYRQDLESIGTQLDLTAMSKNEQLVYWYNLHNIALIEQIAKQYPVKHPSEMKVDNSTLHDAKILNVKGTPLSLRDIRENIVYPNWSSPDTIYGFFLGDIGGPRIERFAFTGTNLDWLLQSNAEEFVNSLRGVHEASKTRKVSKLYDDTKRFYFPNFDQDLTAHLLSHANSEVAEEIASGKPIAIDKYDRVIADMKGGERDRIAGFRVTDASGGTIDVTSSTYQYLQEVDKKTKIMRNRGMIGNSGGTVTIEDIATIELGPLPGTTTSPPPEEE